MLMWILGKVFIMPTVGQIVFAEKDFDSWDLKIHTPRNYLQSFYVNSLIDKCGTTKNYPLAMFQNGISKKTRSYYIVMMDDVIPLFYSDSTITSKEKKNLHATFKIKMKIHCRSLKADDDALFTKRKKNLPLY